MSLLIFDTVLSELSSKLRSKAMTGAFDPAKFARRIYLLADKLKSSTPADN